MGHSRCVRRLVADARVPSPLRSRPGLGAVRRHSRVLSAPYRFQPVGGALASVFLIRTIFSACRWFHHWFLDARAPLHILYPMTGRSIDGPHALAPAAPC